MAFYHRLVQPIDSTKPTEELLACSLLASLAYVRQEVVLENAMKLYLGTGNFEWFETPGVLDCNYVLTQQADGIVVAFSGTENISQFLYYSCTGLNISRSDLNGARCHVGFGDIASNVLDDLVARIRPENIRAPITLVGHSLGAAVALLIGAMLRVRGTYNVRNIVTFGSPAVATVDFRLLLTNVNKVIVANQGDIVPYLPPEVGINWRVALVNIPVFLFYHFDHFFPWLLATTEGEFVIRESIFGNLPRSLVSGVWNLFANPELLSSSRDPQLIAPHLVKNYFSRMQRWLRARGINYNEPFYDIMISLVKSLNSPGEFVTEIPQSQFNQLVIALGLQQGLVAPPPASNDPYAAFYDWAAGARQDVFLEVGLYARPIPRNQVRLADIVEPTFSGYRRAGDTTWAKKGVDQNASASAQSGLLTWVQDRASNLQTVYGSFVLMKHDGKETLIGARDFENPIEFGNVGLKVAEYVQPVAIYHAVTLAGESKKTSAPSLYGFSYLLLEEVAGQGEFTSFNAEITFPNSLQVFGNPSFGGGAGGERTWWEYRGRDRNLIRRGAEVLQAIQKRDARVLEKRPPLAPILDPSKEDLFNSLQDVICQLTFNLLVVRG